MRRANFNRIAMSIISMVIGSGCMSPHYTSRQIAGVPAPPIRSPSEMGGFLRPIPDKQVGFIAAVTGVLTTPLKCWGICGWTDYQMEARAIGRVIQARLSSDRLFTVDLLLEDLCVDNTRISLDAPAKYIRLEVYQGTVPVPKSVRNEYMLTVSTRGRLVWDGDGHLEIHPQHDGDYVRLHGPSDRSKHHQTSGIKNVRKRVRAYD